MAGLLLTLVSSGAQASASPRHAKLAATVTLLAGSTLTATVPDAPVRPAGPAHAPRSSPLTGSLRAPATPGWTSAWDILDVPFRGSIAPTSFIPDPLCPGASAPAKLEVVAPSQFELTSSGRVGWSLVIKGGAAQLFGCAPAGPLAGTTTIPLHGRTEIGATKRIALRGTVSDIALPDGSTGQLTASVVVRVNLRHRV